MLTSIKPTPINMINNEEYITDKNLVKTKIWWSPNNEVPKTYKFNIGIFELGTLEEILQLLIKPNNTVIVTSTITQAGKTSFLWNVNRSKLMQEYEIPVFNHGDTMEINFLAIHEVLVKYLSPYNAPTKKIRTVRNMLRK